MSLQKDQECCVHFLAVTMAALLILQVPLTAQEQSEIVAPALKIAVTKGDGSTNNIKKGTAAEPMVTVSDEKDRPVSGVMVMFTLPDTGPGGAFGNNAKNLIAYTDADGHAVARGLRPNQVAGKFQVVVDASFHGLTARATIHQTNVMPPTSGISPKLIAILAIAGGAAAAGAIAASSGSKGTSTTPVTPPPTNSTTLSAGTPTFGPPQ
jgi:hypothetical protein